MGGNTSFGQIVYRVEFQQTTDRHFAVDGIIFIDVNFKTQFIGCDRSDRCQREMGAAVIHGQVAYGQIFAVVSPDQIGKIVKHQQRFSVRSCNGDIVFATQREQVGVVLRIGLGKIVLSFTENQS